MHALSTNMNDALRMDFLLIMSKAARQSSVVWVIFAHQCLPEIERRTLARN